MLLNRFFILLSFIGFFSFANVPPVAVDPAEQAIKVELLADPVFIDQVDIIEKEGYEISTNDIKFTLLGYASGFAGVSANYLVIVSYSTVKGMVNPHGSSLKMLASTLANNVTSVTYLDDNFTNKFEVGTKITVHDKNTLPVLPEGLKWRLIASATSNPKPGKVAVQVQDYTYKIVKARFVR